LARRANPNLKYYVHAPEIKRTTVEIFIVVSIGSQRKSGARALLSVKIRFLALRSFNRISPWIIRMSRRDPIFEISSPHLDLEKKWKIVVKAGEFFEGNFRRDGNSKCRRSKYNSRVGY